MRKGQGCPIPPVRRYFLRLHGMHCQGVSGGADSAHCSVVRGNCQLASRSINFGRRTVLPLPLAGGVAGVTKPQEGFKPGASGLDFSFRCTALALAVWRMFRLHCSDKVIILLEKLSEFYRCVACVTW